MDELPPSLQKLGLTFLAGVIMASLIWYLVPAISRSPSPSSSSNPSSLTKLSAGEAHLAPTDLGNATLPVAELTVDVSGAVVSPGVYKLPADSRVNDALIAAGGVLNDKVNQEYLSKNVNLSQKVTDGLKIYIPFAADNVAVLSQSVAGSSATSGLISVNSASASELDTLAGVGPATITKIVEGRPYGSLEELVTKKALSQSVYEKIKDKLTL